ncbi:Tim17/Tim22/Tim23/Pmp24 family-domain-containing protein [Cantharellus anzutake]|uniref:Tim17/Tim22/Tim23/Pmp24 family-domain-containing protein n=1 Tax=Cantharellus anzutake TaxID=1750568 RepID=UPI0019065854|nr:Tim17/Tim22/Tim23/Pmp24 family-domain-containing protein [Cantharellus anzutake]KAF8342644.1 Tim17/Tim22/Tim23/Pmp24 family-domain-containing protein [Cantharellus anzutake]
MSKPSIPLVAPVFPAGREPLPPGLAEDDRPALDQQRKMQEYMSMGAESCVFKCGMAGVMGFGLGAFFSMMSTSFAYEDPLSRTWQQENMSTRQKTTQVFKDMGKGMYKSGKGFGKVGALYSGVECIIEECFPCKYRAKNDINNALSAGFVSGAILAHNSGPRAAVAGGLAFAAFSGAIDLFMRREPAEYVSVRSHPRHF